jgi:hypothetical protein
MEATRKSEKPSERWREKVEEDFNVIEIKNSQAMARDRWEWRKFFGSQGPQPTEGFNNNNTNTNNNNNSNKINVFLGYMVAQLVETLRYKLEGR